MLFNSFTFIIFFILVLIFSRRIVSWRYRKAFLLAASYLFYAAWNPPFVALLWISTIVDWKLARWIDTEKVPLRRRFYFSLSLVLNLGVLGYFKYGNFAVDNFVHFLSLFGVSFKPGPMDIVLPVGISFYTFQTLSYTFDVYRRRIKSWPSLLDYSLYVTFFPQLVAGPIVRAENFLPQCSRPKKASAPQLAWGSLLILLGLFTKMFVADALLSGIVERVYDSAGVPTFLEAWTATFAFAVQIFCDFSGYSTIAIGTAMALGFVLPENFNFPYAAVGLSDFWRRWHISFSSWLRDYVYIPLGGNRCGRARMYANLMMTMLIGGLWHGASWMFVLWGGLHGFYLVIERWLCRLKLSTYVFWRYRWVRFFLMIGTFLLVCLTWVFFRSKDISKAFSVLSSMAGSGGFLKPWGLLTERMGYSVLAITAAVLVFHAVLKERSFRWFYKKIPWWAQGMITGVMIFGVILSLGGEDRAFIYFQF